MSRLIKRFKSSKIKLRETLAQVKTHLDTLLALQATSQLLQTDIALLQALVYERHDAPEKLQDAQRLPQQTPKGTQPSMQLSPSQPSPSQPQTPDARKRHRSEGSSGNDSSDFSQFLELMGRKCRHVHVIGTGGPFSMNDVAANLLNDICMPGAIPNLLDFIENISSTWICLTDVAKRGSRARPLPTRNCRAEEHDGECTYIRVQEQEGKKKLNVYLES